MTGAILLLGFLAGLDNLQVCSSIGLLPIRPRRMHGLAVAFSLCEMAAPFLGLAVGRTLSIASPWLTLASGLVVLSCAFRKESPVNAGDHPALLALPFTMSLDNFAAGFCVSTLSGPVWLATFVIGVISAAMSCIGLYASCSVRWFLPRIVSAHAEGIVGTYLCMLAVRMLCDAV